jgi:hypothetical protein
MWVKRNAYRILVEKPEGKISLRRPNHRWENNIKTDLSEIDLDGVDWIHLAEDGDQWKALTNLLNCWVP